jgi:hypothetical protein
MDIENSIEYNNSIKTNYTDVKVREGPLNFRSYSFLKEVAIIKEENKRLDKISQPDPIRMLRRIDI